MKEIDNHPLKKRYNIDIAFNEITRFYKRWFLPLFGISLVSSLLTSFMSAGIDISGLQGNSDPAALIAAMKPMAWRYMLIAVIGLYFTILLQYFIIVRPLSPESDLTADIIRVTTRFLFPVLAVYIILSVLTMAALMLGVVILIIGALFAGLYAMIFFALTAPVMMIENGTIGDTLSRIFTLGHRRFWTNMGFVALFTLILIIISLVLSAIIMIPFSGGFLKSILNPESAGGVTELVKRPSYLILGAVSSALTMPLFPIFSLVLYFNITEGIEEEIVADSDNGGNGRVTVEDLYSDYDREEKSGKNRLSDTAAPTIDDLTP
jgi:hypothetical protein